ncbi:Lipase, secreted [Cordyceps fumosorosea ARSEF 2679]|uniref:Lipase, secreted n=1 Tax=Cordyceps fumosorosea (strain ARSEF 2679) TaxID=1081104 RepID=A0A167Q6D5_CORFA|nr:Lipase, secreted [Cordyceps fumosorosea ARSEF 2679]OAA57339.1 Lipase, secreted [Cordyceps fumosorosea ARSEF 2679]
MAGFLYLGSIAKHAALPVAAHALPPTDDASGMAIPPSRDRWYRAVDGLRPPQNGGLIKIRAAPGNLSSMLRNLDWSDQILYRTLDANGTSTWAVTTVLVPKTADPARPAVVSYQMSQDSASLDASPSYLLSTANENVRYDILDRMLLKGWQVVVPDYEGSLAAFGAGKLAGHATLDSIRVVHSLADERYGMNKTKALYSAWGYSGGALATAWAYKQWFGHANELGDRLTSYVIGGLPADLLETLHSLDGTMGNGLAINAISGLMSQYPQFNETIRSHAKTTGPLNITAFDRVKTQTFSESLIRYARHNISDYFVGGLDAVVRELQKVGFDKEVSLLDLPEALPRDLNKHAILLYHALADEVAPIRPVDELVRNWCNASHRIEFHRLQGGGHVQNGDRGIESAIEWITERFRSGFETGAQGRIIP